MSAPSSLSLMLCPLLPFLLGSHCSASQGPVSQLHCLGGIVYTTAMPAHPGQVTTPSFPPSLHCTALYANTAYSCFHLLRRLLKMMERWKKLKSWSMRAVWKICTMLRFVPKLLRLTTQLCCTSTKLLWVSIAGVQVASPYLLSLYSPSIRWQRSGLLRFLFVFSEEKDLFNRDKFTWDWEQLSVWPLSQLLPNYGRRSATHARRSHGAWKPGKFPLLPFCFVCPCCAGPEFAEKNLWSLSFLIVECRIFSGGGRTWRGRYYREQFERNRRDRHCQRGGIERWQRGATSEFSVL